jgi:hypothetical protein
MGAPTPDRTPYRLTYLEAEVRRLALALQAARPPVSETPLLTRLAITVPKIVDAVGTYPKPPADVFPITFLDPLDNDETQTDIDFDKSLRSDADGNHQTFAMHPRGEYVPRGSIVSVHFQRGIRGTKAVGEGFVEDAVQWWITDEHDWMAVSNASGETIPPFAVMVPGDLVGGSDLTTVTQFDGTAAKHYLVNSRYPIPSPGIGIAYHATGRSQTILKHSSGDTAHVGETWGPVADSWGIAKSKPGFVVTRETLVDAGYITAIQSTSVGSLMAYNDSNVTIKAYQPVKVYGPWKSDDTNPVLSEWDSNNQMLLVTPFDGSNDDIHMFHRWGVVQEEIPGKGTGKIVIDGWTPCRTLYKSDWNSSAWKSASPVANQNYCRITNAGSCDLQFNVAQTPDADNIVFNYVCLNRHSQNIGFDFYRSSTTSAPTTSNQYYSFASNTIGRGCNLAKKDWTAYGGSGLDYGNGRGVEALGPVVVSGNATAYLTTATFGTAPQTNNFECGYLKLAADGSVLDTVRCTYSQGYYATGSIVVRNHCILHAWIRPVQLTAGQGLMFYVRGDSSSSWSGWLMDGTCKYIENWPVI